MLFHLPLFFRPFAFNYLKRRFGVFSFSFFFSFSIPSSPQPAEETAEEPGVWLDVLQARAHSDVSPLDPTSQVAHQQDTHADTLWVNHGTSHDADDAVCSVRQNQDQ